MAIGMSMSCPPSVHRSIRGTGPSCYVSSCTPKLPRQSHLPRNSHQIPASRLKKFAWLGPPSAKRSVGSRTRQRGTEPKSLNRTKPIRRSTHPNRSHCNSGCHTRLAVLRRVNEPNRNPSHRLIVVQALTAKQPMKNEPWKMEQIPFIPPSGSTEFYPCYRISSFSICRALWPLCSLATLC